MVELAILLVAISAMGLSVYALLEASRRARCACVDVDRLATKLTAAALVEFKTDAVPSADLRRWTFTEYTVWCAEFGLPQEITADLLAAVQDNFNTGFIDGLPQPEDEGNFLFDGSDL